MQKTFGQRACERCEDGIEWDLFEEKNMRVRLRERWASLPYSVAPSRPYIVPREGLCLCRGILRMTAGNEVRRAESLGGV